MRTLRFHFPVLETHDVDEVLSLVTDVHGVVAALVDVESATLDVGVSSHACALLVKEELLRALLVGSRAIPA